MTQITTARILLIIQKYISSYNSITINYLEHTNNNKNIQKDKCNNNTNSESNSNYNNNINNKKNNINNYDK